MIGCDWYLSRVLYKLIFPGPNAKRLLMTIKKHLVTGNLFAFGRGHFRIGVSSFASDRLDGFRVFPVTYTLMKTDTSCFYFAVGELCQCRC
jgi:hypothetical protein